MPGSPATRRCLPLMLISPLALADTPVPELAPTVITAVAPVANTTLSADTKTARQPVPASDAADYLKTFPGFSVIRNGGANGDPVLRGQFGSRLNLLSNGGNVLGACPGRMDAPSAYITPEAYDRLTVIKGPQSVQWGPGASAGTVMFERDPEHLSQLGGRLYSSATLASGRRFDKVLDAAAGGPAGYARLSATDATSSDYRDGAERTVPSAWSKWSRDVALGWHPQPGTLLELSAGMGDGSARYATRGMDGSRFRRESLGLRAEQADPGLGLARLEGQFYYNYADHVMDNYSLRDPVPGRERASNPDRRTQGMRVKGTWEGEQWALLAGVDGQASEHRRRVTMGVERYRQLPRQADASFTQAGVFGEFTHHLSDSTRLVSGARLDHHQARDLRVQGASTTRTELLPAGFARWEHTLPGGASLYAGVGHVQRQPDYWELFSPANSAFTTLRPEKTTQLDVGARHHGDHLSTWVSAYAGQLRDYILFDYTAPHSTARNIDAAIWGGEAGTDWHFASRWVAGASLAYARGHNRSDGKPLPQMPPLDTRLSLAWQHQNLSAGALWRLVGAQRRIDPGKGNVVGRDREGSSGFGVFSLNTAWQATRRFRLSAGVDNLFGKTYTEHLNLAGNAGWGYPAHDPKRINEPGRTFWTKAELEI